MRSRPPRVRRDRTTVAALRVPLVATERGHRHIHSWHVALSEEDDFGSVRMYECRCGARHYAACA